MSNEIEIGMLTLVRTPNFKCLSRVRKYIMYEYYDKRPFLLKIVGFYEINLYEDLNTGITSVNMKDVSVIESDVSDSLLVTTLEVILVAPTVYSFSPSVRGGSPSK